MFGEEAFIVSIVFGSVVAIVFLGVMGSIISSWIKRGSGKNLSENKEFLNALREFKEKTDRRLSNLEAIVTDEKPTKTQSNTGKKESLGKEQKSAIQIEIENESSKEDQDQVKNSKLKNMLNQ
ncbi:MAG: hypothetical protein WDZ38_07435 [Balneolaceae bacterium]